MESIFPRRERELPPISSYEAEMSALGAMLLSQRVCDLLLGILSEKHFYRPAHRHMFVAMRRVTEFKGAVEFPSLKEQLIEDGNLQNIGGEDYILQVMDFPPGPANAMHYAKVLMDYCFRREIALAGILANEIGEEDATVPKIRERIASAMDDLSKIRAGVSGKLSDFTDSPDTKGIPTGFNLIDGSTTCAGLPVGQTSVIVADTKGGKTAWSCQVAMNAARGGYSVVYATFADLNATGLNKRVMRLLCGRSKKPTDPFWLGEWQSAATTIERADFTVYDASGQRDGRNIEAFLAWLGAQRDCPDLVVFDYAQKLRSSAIGKRGNLLDHAEEVSSIIKFHAAENGYAALIGSQQTNGSEKEGRKAITKGSRVWEEDAALVISPRILSDEEREKTPEVRLEKGATFAELRYNRFGQSGVSTWWKFDGDRVSFREL